MTFSPAAARNRYGELRRLEDRCLNLAGDFSRTAVFGSEVAKGIRILRDVLLAERNHLARQIIDFEESHVDGSA